MNGVGYGITPFMGASGILARSSGGGGVPFVNEYSMSLDGVDEWFNVANSTSLNITSAQTFSMWFKTTSSAVMYPITHGSGSQLKYYIQLYATSNRIRLVIYDGSGVGVTIDNTEVFDDGQWHHLAFTSDALTTTDGVKVYFDGNLLTNKGTLSNNGIRSITQNLFIGRTPNSTSFFFKDNLDEISYFNSELSASDVNAIYNSGVPTSLSSYPSLVSWWRMGDGDTWGGSSWTLTDNGSGGNNATSVNMEEADRLPISPNSYTQNSFNFNFNSYFTLATKTQNFTDFSLSFWILSRGGNNKTLFANDSLTVANGGGILANIQDSAYRVRYFDDSTGYTNLSDTLIGSVWNHVVITYQSSTNELKGYTNNVLFTTLNPTITTLANNSHSFDKIGYSVGTNYTGSNLDEISVFDSVLNPTQISQIFGIGTPNDISSLSPVHHWRMGENATWNGSTWTITDIGSSPITLTSNGMTEAYKTGDQAYVL